jgi:hypothetical protein
MSARFGRSESGGDRRWVDGSRAGVRAHARGLLIAVIVSAAASGVAAGGASAERFPFQPITFKRIDLPSKIKEVTRPLFTVDGLHLLFHFNRELWITSLNGTKTRCLSCGLRNDPRSPGEELATPFPDGKRVFFGGYVQPGPAQMAVLECRPSVANCKSAKILPVDFSQAEPATIPAGGAVRIAQSNLMGASTAKLSQDGKHVGFSDLRSDSVLNMVVAKLSRAAGKYELTDPRVINPPGPTSATDPHVADWSDSSALYEFKSFTDGGADATYVQVGGINRGPDVWSVNLKTGRRTHLTANPDWDEDNAVSPNGKLLSLWSNRTMHFADFIGGLLPVRDFINAPVATMASGAIGANKMCHGPMWLLPASGDQGGTLAGEPIVSYDYPNVTVTNNLTGAPQWSPDGTMIALNTNLTKQPYVPERGRNAPFLLVARLMAQQPTRPLRTVSSDVGSWAPTPAEYHGALGYKGTVVLRGPGGGTVTVSYAGAPGPGVLLGGQWAETYRNYSDNAVDFVNGTVTITGLTAGTYSAHLTMTGRHIGSQDTDLTFKHLSVSGHSTSTLDGHSISGPKPDMVNGGACPSLLPKKPALRITARRRGDGVYRLKVTASIAGVGPNESAVDTEPVNRAAVRLAGRTTLTNAQGIAIVKVPGSRGLTVTVTAGDTLKPTSAFLRGS